VTVTGQVTNNEIGYPAVNTQPVSVDELGSLTPISVASGTTDATGRYSITFTPHSSGSYQVSTGAISQIEDATLSPPYGDILSPGASTASALVVNGTAAITKTTTTPGSVTMSGTIGPAAVDTKATVTLLARPKTSKGAFKTIATQSPAAGASVFSLSGKLAASSWTVEVQYADPGAFTTATSATKNVTVALGKGPKVSYKKLTVNKGKVTLTGSLSLAPTGTKATLRLYVRVISKLSNKKFKSGKARSVEQVTVKPDKKTFTFKRTFKRGYRYVLQVRYTHTGQKTTNSKNRTVAIH
jgi:hypothetical protein